MFRTSKKNDCFSDSPHFVNQTISSFSTSYSIYFQLLAQAWYHSEIKIDLNNSVNLAVNLNAIEVVLNEISVTCRSVY